jgi:hypothetical protein
MLFLKASILLFILLPSTFGDRGLGGELQYRQNIKEKSWFELNTLGINDRIYEPNKVEGKRSPVSLFCLIGKTMYGTYMAVTPFTLMKACFKVTY